VFALANRDPRVLEYTLGQHARDPLSGRSAACVHDSAPRVPALEAEVVVECDAQRVEI
jgi:hypothetical protein